MYDVLNVYLENGLRVIMHRIPHIKTVSCGLWVKQGSKYEDDQTNGLSHLLEHLMINPDNDMNPNFQNLIKEISSEGIVYNAGTTKESTSYYMYGLAKNLEKCLKTLSSIVTQNKTFSTTLFENEKKVVTQETISFFSSFNQIKERTSQALWGNMDVGRIIVGNIDNVKNAKLEDIEKILVESYTPENSTLIVLGGIDYYQTLDMIEENFSCWKDSETRSYKEAVESAPGIYFNSTNNGENSVVSVGFRIPGYRDVDRLHIEAMSQILGSPALESRLTQEIRMKRGLAYTLGAFTNSYENRGSLGFTAVCAHKHVPEVIKIMIDEFQKAKNYGFSDEEINKARKVLETNTLFDIDNLTAHLKFLGKCSTYGQLFSLEQELRNIEKIRKDSIQKITNDIFTEDNMCLAAIGNFNIDETIEFLKLS